jgi:hypothetical protein
MAMARIEPSEEVRAARPRRSGAEGRKTRAKRDQIEEEGIVDFVGADKAAARNVDRPARRVEDVEDARRSRFGDRVQLLNAARPRSAEAEVERKLVVRVGLVLTKMS